MAWGISIWGVDLLGAIGPAESVGGPNLSFENLKAGYQGDAAAWSVVTESTAEDVAVFPLEEAPSAFWGGDVWDASDWSGAGAAAGLWYPWESFEGRWRQPFLVHFVADATNTVPAPSSLASWADCAALLSDVVDYYAAHVLSVGNVHIAQDLDNYLSFGDLDPGDTGLIMAHAVILRDAINSHMTSWPGVHMKWDTQNTINAADPTDLASTISLLTELRTDFNDHVNRTGYGSANEDALFELSVADVVAGIFHPDLQVESYERLWDLGALQPSGFDQLALVSMPGPGSVQVDIDSVPNDGDYIIVTDLSGTTVAFEYDTDGVWDSARTRIDIAGAVTVSDVRIATVSSISGTSLLFVVSEPAAQTFVLEPTTGERVTQTTFDVATSDSHLAVSFPDMPSWPAGHMEFIATFEHIVSQRGIGDGFDMHWLLPGNLAAYPNHVFTANYYVDGEFTFPAGSLSFGITDDFESGWKSNDTALAAYWSGAEWRFDLTARPTPLEAGGFGDYNVYMELDLDGFAFVLYGPLPGSTTVWSPNMRVRASTSYTATGDYPALDITVSTVDSGSQIVTCMLPTSMAAGEILELDLNAVAYGFYEITSFSLAGAIPDATGVLFFEGLETNREAFESDWTLSLDS